MGREHLVFIVDNRSSTTQLLFEDYDKSFIELSKDVLTTSFRQSMVFDANDLVGGFIFGCSETSNKFATQNIPGYEHVCQWMDFKQPTGSDMERLIELVDIPTASTSAHPVSAIQLALDMMLSADAGRSRPGRTILMMTPFSHTGSRSLTRETLLGVRADVLGAQVKGKPVNITVRWLGAGERAHEAVAALHACVAQESSTSLPAPGETLGVKEEGRVRVTDEDWALWQYTGLTRAQAECVLAYPCGEGVLDAAALCGPAQVALVDEEAVRGALALPYRKASPVAQDMPLHVGDVRLGTSLFSCVSEAKAKVKRCAPGGADVRFESALVDADANEVPEDERMRGVEYGGTLVAHARAVEDAERGVCVLRAVSRVGVRPELWAGPTEILAGSKKSGKDAALLAALARAAASRDVVLLARVVRRAGAAAHLAALYPQLRGTEAWFVKVRLPFADDLAGEGDLVLVTGLQAAAPQPLPDAVHCFERVLASMREAPSHAAQLLRPNGALQAVLSQACVGALDSEYTLAEDPERLASLRLLTTSVGCVADVPADASLAAIHACGLGAAADDRDARGRVRGKRVLGGEDDGRDRDRDQNRPPRSRAGDALSPRRGNGRAHPHGDADAAVEAAVEAWGDTCGAAGEGAEGTDGWVTTLATMAVAPNARAGAAAQDEQGDIKQESRLGRLAMLFGKAEDAAAVLPVVKEVKEEDAHSDDCEKSAPVAVAEEPGADAAEREDVDLEW